MLTLRIKEICREKNITLNELAERIGMTQPSISRLASGRQKPSFDTLEELSAALGVPVGELFASPDMEEPVTERSIDARVKSICKQRGILIKELASKLGISDISLRASLKGNPTIGTLERVADALGVSVTSLLEKEKSFIAFVYRDGETHTFNTEKDLKDFIEFL